jgi:FMN phosphatase YigB (HAD superfamily)
VANDIDRSLVAHSTVFLFDVDNTLLDNDAVTDDLKQHLLDNFGEGPARRYWELFEQLRSELGYADYLGALQRYRIENPRDTGLLRASLYLLHYPFANRVYPGALDAVRHAEQRGRVAILSDGDVVFQPRKVERSGLWGAVEGNVLIYIHKEEMLEDVERRFPAERYVMVDDKIRILTAMKSSWGARLTTVFVRQGHYALDAELVAQYPPADITIERIGDLPGVNFA